MRKKEMRALQNLFSVIPAKVGIQTLSSLRGAVRDDDYWIPASAGMTNNAHEIFEDVVSGRRK